VNVDNPNAEKVAVVNEVRDRLEASGGAILTEYRGLSVQNLADVRSALAPAGGTYKIYKNTLMRLAVREAGLEGLEPLLVGPTAVAFVDGDAAAVAKALRDFARNHPELIVKGGVLGSNVLSAEETTALATLPSREVLLAQLAGAFAAPMQRFAGLMAALPRNFAYGLAALVEAGGGSPAETSSPAEAEPQPEAEAAAESSEAAAAESSEAAAAESSEAAAPESTDTPTEPTDAGEA
jgi:large subunit ribosomal protein L10